MVVVQEVQAVRTTAQRGVCMVTTTHGTDLAGVLRNPDLNPLLGGVASVTLGDMAAFKSNWGVKTRPERRSSPAFAAAVEVLGLNRWVPLGGVGGGGGGA